MKSNWARLLLTRVSNKLFVNFLTSENKKQDIIETTEKATEKQKFLIAPKQNLSLDDKEKQMFDRKPAKSPANKMMANYIQKKIDDRTKKIEPIEAPQAMSKK